MSENESDLTTSAETWTLNYTRTEYTDAIVIPLQVFKAAVNVANLAVNILGLVGLLGGRGMDKPKGVFILFLIVHNIGVGILAMPGSLVAGSLGYWPFGDIACKITAFVQGYLLRAVMLAHTLICVERYVAIRWPYWYVCYVTHKILAWVSVVAIGIMTIVGAGYLSLCNSGQYLIKFETCFPSSCDHKIYRYIVIGYYIVCYSVILFTTVQVGRIAHRHRCMIAAQDRVSKQEIAGQEGEILESFQAVLLMTVVFIVCSVPLTVLMAFMERVPDKVLTLSVWILFLHTVISTLVYQTRTKAFREDIKSLLPICVSRKVQPDVGQP